MLRQAPTSTIRSPSCRRRHTNSWRWACYESPMRRLSYHRHRFPAEVIQYAVWMYFRFPLSFRDVEDLLAQRGIDVSYETVRRWSVKFGLAYARKLRRSHPPADTRWHLDEVFVSINGRTMYLWRAVDCEGEVLDLLIQSRRNKRAALKPLQPQSSQTNCRPMVPP
jgi:putative transposase